MVSASESRPGTGGKFVTNRRRQRLTARPYDRPPPRPPKSPNWFTGVIIPSARAIASGAGKIISSALFSDSDSSSSEDFDSGSGDKEEREQENEGFTENGIYNVNEYENEEKVTSLDMIQRGRESQFSVQKTETKQLIEQLIMQESFSMEECDRLTKVLNSRVKDWTTEAGEKRSLMNSPGQTVEHEDIDVFNKAILEAKKWFQERRGASSSVADLAHETCNLNSAAFDHIGSGVGSPVDMARSYMGERPPWASPPKCFELRTPLTTTIQLFKEGTPHSIGHDILSSSKRRNSLASGSWNIQEELRKVRSKTIDDMLCTPPAKIDSSLHAVAPSREESTRAGEVVSGVGNKISETHSSWKTRPIDALIDVEVSSDPALVALESRQDGKASEAPSSNPYASVPGNNEDSEAIQIDGERASSKFPYHTSPNHADEQLSDPRSTKINGPPGAEAAEFGGRDYINVFSSNQASLSPGEEKHKDLNVSESRLTNNINVEGNCGLLSEAYMEVPIVTETNSIASNSQISLDVEYEDSPLEMSQPSTEEKPDPVTGKQQGRKQGKNNRRSRGRGK